MVHDLADRNLIGQRQAQDVLVRHSGARDPGNVSEADAAVEGRIPDEDAPGGADHS
jgi:hypothetical protein